MHEAHELFPAGVGLEALTCQDACVCAGGQRLACFWAFGCGVWVGQLLSGCWKLLEALFHSN